MTNPVHAQILGLLDERISIVRIRDDSALKVAQSNVYRHYSSPESQPKDETTVKKLT